MSQCPKCRTATLAPISAGPDAPARCSACRGVWVPRHAIVLEDLDEPSRDAVSQHADARAGLCPAGHGLMWRVRLEGDLGFALDRCSTCSGTWFDAGEWSEIASRHLLDSLDDFWDPLKQKQAREEKGLQNWRGALLASLGEKTMGELEDLAQVLATHQDGGQALAYLQEAVRVRRPGAAK